MLRLAVLPTLDNKRFFFICDICKLRKYSSNYDYNNRKAAEEAERLHVAEMHK